MPSDRSISRISSSLGARGAALGREAERPALPAQRRAARRQGRPRAGPAADHDRPQVAARSEPRRVVYLADGERMIVIGSNAGNDRVPAWALNLKANPEAEVEIGRSALPVRARVAEGAERAELWRRCNEQYAGFDDYERAPTATSRSSCSSQRRRASWRRGASAPRAGASASSACCSRSGGSARG